MAEQIKDQAVQPAAAEMLEALRKVAEEMGDGYVSNPISLNTMNLVRFAIGHAEGKVFGKAE